uniref:Uncharacterized protein n=1 Tax=Arundo donax TaxID=35708 RepID=A0A0A9E7H5_ARUDO
MVSLGSSFAFTLFNTYVADLFFPCTTAWSILLRTRVSKSFHLFNF